MSDLYILDDENRPVRIEDMLEWAKWSSDNHARHFIKQERIGRYFVSTRFLGMDMDIGGEVRAMLGFPRQPPLVFETMAFDEEVAIGDPGRRVALERCATWSEAEQQHAEVVRRLADK